MLHSTQSTILDMGNLQAPEGSAPWCTAVRIEAWQLLPELRFVRERAAAVVGVLRRDENFRQLKDRKGRGFKTWEAFCREPYPYGLGIAPEDLEDLLGSLAPPGSAGPPRPDLRQPAPPGVPTSAAAKAGR